MCLFGICPDVLYVVDSVVSGDRRGFWGVDVGFCGVSKHEFKWDIWSFSMESEIVGVFGHG